MVSGLEQNRLMDRNADHQLISSLRVSLDPSVNSRRIIVPVRYRRTQQAALLAQNSKSGGIPIEIIALKEGVDMLDYDVCNGMIMILDSNLCLHKLRVNYLSGNSDSIKSYEKVELGDL